MSAFPAVAKGANPSRNLKCYSHPHSGELKTLAFPVGNNTGGFYVRPFRNTPQFRRTRTHFRWQRIDAATVTTELRNFAQGLLVEVVDATYALGYAEILLTTFYTPGGGMKKVFMKAGRRAARHWFKHATDRDLHNAKIAEAVRRQLSLAFQTPMREKLDGLALGRTPESVAS